MKRELLFGLLACLLLVSFVHAQTNTGDIVGTVRIADGSPIPGVAITLTGNVTGKRAVVSSAQGNYRFPTLAPGFYNLTYELTGFKKVERTQIRVSVGVSTTLNVEMEPGAVEEFVTVVGQKNMISLRQTTVATSITRDVMDTLPLGRGWLAVINMAPGVLSELQGGGITGKESISGQTFFYGPGTEDWKNSWSVDGASTDGRFYPGEMGAAISKGQLEETQVSISSHDIMNVSGGVSVNFVSKRGGNRVSGDLYIELMDSLFQRDQKLPSVFATHNWISAGVNRIWDYAASLGGPLWQDHLWYFGSASISDSITHSKTNSITRPTFDGNYYFKFNAQYKNTTAQFSYNWANTETLHTPISAYTTATQDRLSPSSFYTAEIQHVMGNLLLTAKMTNLHSIGSLHSGDEGWLPDKPSYKDGRRINFPHRAWTYNYAVSAPKSALPPISMMVASDEEGHRPYFVAYADYFFEKFLGGGHEFKIGVDYANNKMNQESLCPNHIQIAYNIKDASLTWPDGTKPGVASVVTICSDDVGQRYTRRQSYFFQDTATYKRLTLNFGLRYDHHSWGWDDITMGSMDNWNADQGENNGPLEPWTGALEIKAGKVPVEPKSWSPRISATYDLTGDGKNVIKASWANYTGILSNVYNRGIMPGSSRYTGMPFFDFNHNFWPDPGEYFLHTPGEMDVIKQERTAPGWNYYWYSAGLSPLHVPSASASSNVYNPNWSTPWVTEITLGYDRQLTQDITVGLSGYHKTETRGTTTYRYEGTQSNYTVQYPKDTHWTQVGTDPVTGNNVYTADPRAGSVGNYYTDDRFNWTYYWGAEFSFHKRLSHNWMFNFNFNYQDYAKHLNQAENNPSSWYYFDGGAADPAHYRSGQIWFNARWMIKANGLYVLPAGFTVSASLIANEGNPVYNGRNTMFGVTLYPKNETYGDLRLPDIVQLNLALERRFNLAEGVSLVLEARYFNVFNNTTVIRVGQFEVPQTMTPDTVTSPGILQFGVRLNWR